MYITVIYIIWFLIPTVFFSLSLWAKLEQLAKSHHKQNPGDYFRQGCFVLFCVGLAIIIDQFILAGVIEFIDSDWIPLPLAQVLLLPVIFVLAAKAIGPTKAISITKAPRPTEKKKNR